VNRAAPVVESLRLRLVACSLPTSEQTGKITGNVNRFVLNKLLILFILLGKESGKICPRRTSP
jgi:hypothetical protein